MLFLNESIYIHQVIISAVILVFDQMPCFCLLFIHLYQLCCDISCMGSVLVCSAHCALKVLIDYHLVYFSCVHFTINFMFCIMN